MAKYIDADKLKAEIARLKGQLIRGACAAQIEMETNCKDEAYTEVLALIDTLSEEHDKSLEEAAKEYVTTHLRNNEFPTADIAFIAGAKWQKEQIMKNAKDGWIDEECVIVLNDGTRIDLQPDCEKKPAFEFEYAQDVCVIVLPKEY